MTFNKQILWLLALTSISCTAFNAQAGCRKDFIKEDAQKLKAKVKEVFQIETDLFGVPEDFKMEQYGDEFQGLLDAFQKSVEDPSCSSLLSVNAKKAYESFMCSAKSFAVRASNYSYIRYPGSNDDESVAILSLFTLGIYYGAITLQCHSENKSLQESAPILERSLNQFLQNI